MTVTSKLPANAERNKEIEKIQEREEKAASFGGAVRGSVPEDELSGEGAQDDDDDVYYYIGEGPKLEGETENMGV